MKKGGNRSPRASSGRREEGRGLGERSLRLHAILEKVSARGEPRNRIAFRRVSCQAEMASSKSLLAQASLGWEQPGRALPPGNTAGKQGGPAGGCLPTPSSVAGSLGQRPEPIPPWLPFPMGTWKSDFMLGYLYAAVTSVVSDSVRPHRRQPTRLPRPWDSPGKNTGVDCHFLLQCMKVKSESEVAQSCPTLSDPMDRSLQGSSIHGIFQARVLE